MVFTSGEFLKKSYKKIESWSDFALNAQLLIAFRRPNWMSYQAMITLSLTQSWKQCALPVIPVINRKSCTQVHQLPQSYCGDNGEGALFSWLYVYIIISHHQMRQTRFHHLRGILKVMSFLSSLTDKLWFFFAGINFGEFNIEKYFAGI